MEYMQLIRVLLKADEDYYLHDSPTISDSQYDTLMKELVEYEDLTGEVSPMSPTQRPSGKFVEGPEVNHEVPMLSLANVFNKKNYIEWSKKVGPDVLVACEPKIDGLALTVKYVDGKITYAATRGDGVSGTLVTDKVLNLHCIPNVLNRSVNLEVRGELYLEKKEFREINAGISKSGGTPYANPRNLASGIFRRTDLKDIRESRLKFIMYDAIHDNKNIPYDEALKLAEFYGAPKSSDILTIITSNLVDAHYKDMLARRDKIEYEIDGMVVKVLSADLRKDLGANDKYPKWAVAWKFPAIEAHVKLLGVQFQVSKVGTVTPVAKLEPSVLNGATVTRATLHNPDEITRLNLHYGDTVVIRRSGDTIPAISTAIEDLRMEGAKPVKYPKECPSCSMELSVSSFKGGTTIRCVNAKCPARLVRKLEHFTSKRGMNVKGLAESTLSKLIEYGLVNNFKDLFLLTEEKLKILPNYGAKSTKALLYKLELATTVKLTNLIYAIGIPEVGVSTASDLAESFGSIKAIMDASATEIAASGACGNLVSKCIVNYLADKEVRSEILDLIELLDVEKTMVKNTGLLSNQNWVITGSIVGYSKSSLEELIESHGGRVYDHVSKNVDYCLYGKNPGKKMEEAIKYGIELMNINDLQGAING